VSFSKRGFLPDPHGNNLHAVLPRYADDLDGHLILPDQFKNLFAMRSASNPRTTTPCGVIYRPL